jgi:hypothetical protein
MFQQYGFEITYKVRFDADAAPVAGPHGWQGSIKPVTGAITFYPAHVDGTGDMLYSVQVTGPKVKKDGTPGAVEATYDWRPGAWPEHADVDHVRALYYAFCDTAADSRYAQRQDI